MKFIILIISLVFIASISSIKLPANMFKTATDSVAAHSIMALRIPNDNLPQVLEPLMKERSFKDAYELSLKWKTDDTSPLDRQDLNPLALHNAKLDNQFALRKFTDMLDSDVETDKKKSFILKTSLIEAILKIPN